MSKLSEALFAGNRELSETEVNDKLNFTFETKDGETYDITSSDADGAITAFHKAYPYIKEDDIVAFYDESDIHYCPISGEVLESKMTETVSSKPEFELWDLVRLKDDSGTLGYIANFSEAPDPDDSKDYIEFIPVEDGEIDIIDPDWDTMKIIPLDSVEKVHFADGNAKFEFLDVGAPNINLNLDASGQSVGILGGKGGNADDDEVDEGLVGEVGDAIDNIGKKIPVIGGLFEGTEDGFSVGDKVYYIDDDPKVPGEIVEIFDDGTCLVIINGDPEDQVVVDMKMLDYWDDSPLDESNRFPGDFEVSDKVKIIKSVDFPDLNGKTGVVTGKHKSRFGDDIISIFIDGMKDNVDLNLYDDQISLIESKKKVNESIASEIYKEIKDKYPEVHIRKISKPNDLVYFKFSNYPGEDATGFGNDPRTSKRDNWTKFLDHLLDKYVPDKQYAELAKGSARELLLPKEEIKEDTVRKTNGKWTNRGDDGKEHGEFDTKAEADAQRRAIFANGWKGESKSHRKVQEAKSWRSPRKYKRSEIAAVRDAALAVKDEADLDKVYDMLLDIDAFEIYHAYTDDFEGKQDFSYAELGEMIADDLDHELNDSNNDLILQNESKRKVTEAYHEDIEVGKEYTFQSILEPDEAHTDDEKDLQSKNGMKCTVKSVNDYEDETLYEVKFEDGSWYEVFADELSPVIDEGKKLVEEINYSEIHFQPGPNAEVLSDSEFDSLFDMTANGEMLDPKGSDVPFAWDPVVERVDNQNIVIVGAVAPGGPGYGRVTIEIPASKFSQYYDLYVQPNDRESAEEILKIYNNRGWEEV